MSPQKTIFTVGHSNHTYESLLFLFRSAGITAVADVRTSPYSRHFHQFNKGPFRQELLKDEVAYSFLGKELGGRPKDPSFYFHGVADYELMAKAPDFQHGIQRVLEGAQKFRIALMCSEHEPLDCHRCLLIGRVLAERSVSVKHIHADERILTHAQVEERLLELEGQDGDDLFSSRSERLAIAYRKRARKVAYAAEAIDPSDPIAAA